MPFKRLGDFIEPECKDKKHFLPQEELYLLGDGEYEYTCPTCGDNTQRVSYRISFNPVLHFEGK